MSILIACLLLNIISCFYDLENTMLSWLDRLSNSMCFANLSSIFFKFASSIRRFIPKIEKRLTQICCISDYRICDIGRAPYLLLRFHSPE